MASVAAKTIEGLVKDVEQLKTSIETGGAEARERLKSIKVAEACAAIPRAADGSLDATAWSAFDPAKQEELRRQLNSVRAALQTAAGLDGPAEPGHIMSAEYATNRAIVVWVIIGFALMGSLLAAVRWQWSAATGTDYSQKVAAATAAYNEYEVAGGVAQKARGQEADAADDKARQAAHKTVEGQTARQAEAQRKTLEAVALLRDGGVAEDSVLTMVVLLGALGGSIHFVSSLVMFIGNRQLKRSWLTYYLAMPVIGAGMAPVVYLLLRVGLVAPTAASGNGTSIANLNVMAIYAFSVLTGLFSRAAADKLSEVFATLFRTGAAPSKDALGEEQPPGRSADRSK